MMESLETRRLLADVRPTAGSDPEAFIVIGDTLFFVANDADHGVELWKSDGTEAGTVLVKDIEPGPQSGAPHDFVALEGSLYFFVHDPSGRVQLWQSDGTEGGTTLVTGIFERFGFSKISDPVAFNGAIYFLGESSSNRTGGLLRSDGTAQGTQVIKEFTQPVTASLQDLVALGGALYLGGVDLAHGRELWTSDGTTDGTVLVKDINPGPDSSNPGTLSAEFVFFDGFLYFPAIGTGGEELWKSDGTAAGTTLVKDINPSGSSNPGDFTIFDGAIYFGANDGQLGFEFWRTDGTSAGTVLVKDIFPGPVGSDASMFTVVGDTLLFSAGELWKSDGTADGTVLVKDIHATPGRNSVIREPVNFNGTLIFTAIDGDQFETPPGHGFELWRSDGTEAGTVLLKDVNPGPADGFLGFSLDSAVLGNRMLFPATDGTHGPELWATDGTTDGTELVRDINLQDPPFPFVRQDTETDDWIVTGSALDDVIRIHIENGDVIATRNGFDASLGPLDFIQITIFGGAGDDQIFIEDIAPNARVSVRGNDGDDTITAGAESDTIFGEAGADRILAGPGADLVRGGDGNDVIYALAGYDTIYGGAGSDFISGGDGKDRIAGEAGNDRILGGSNFDQLDGGSGNDRIYGDSGSDKLFGGAGNDTFKGGSGNDFINAGSGDDSIYIANNDIDTLFAGAGVDKASFDPALDLVNDVERVL